MNRGQQICLEQYAEAHAVWLALQAYPTWKAERFRLMMVQIMTACLEVYDELEREL